MEGGRPMTTKKSVGGGERGNEICNGWETVVRFRTSDQGGLCGPQGPK